MGVPDILRIWGKQIAAELGEKEPPLLEPLEPHPRLTTQAAAAEAAERGEGYKADEEKRDWTLIPWEAMDVVVQVLEHGSRKYQRDNWKRVPDARARYVRAAFRHLIAVSKGEKLDPESGLPHFAHAICCLMFALWFDRGRVA